MDKLWFNEDGDRVLGFKNMFKNEKEFIKESNKRHNELTGYGCILDNIECDVFLNVNQTLKEGYVYELKYTDVDIQTLYNADCESLEGYDIEGETGIIKLDDDTLINLQGKEIINCNVCGFTILKEEFNKNNGLCDSCYNELENSFQA